MTASLTLTRRHLIHRLPLALPLAWGASALSLPPASARLRSLRKPMFAHEKLPVYGGTMLADVPDGLLDNATDINEDGIIVGWSYTDGEMFSLAVAWREPDRYDTLPDLGGQASEAYAINDSGQIAGVSLNAEGDARPVLWTDGGVIDLGTLGGLNGSAQGLNNRGQVVGYAETRDGMMHAFLWDNGEMTDLHEFRGSIDVPGVDDDEVEQLLDMAGTSYANDINEAGQIVGRFGFELAFMHAVGWADGEMTDLGTLGGAFSEAMSINDDGLVVGNSDVTMDEQDSPPHAFLWRDGSITSLDPEPDRGWSRATDINADGVVCGRGGSTDSETLSLIWRDDEVITLDADGCANGLNDAGVVIGRVRHPEEHDGTIAAMWEPTTDADG